MSYLLVAVFLIPVALEASGTFVGLGVEIKFRAPSCDVVARPPVPTYSAGISTRSGCYLALAFGTAGSSTTWVHTTELYSTDIRSTAHTLAFIVGRFGGFASGYVVENANSIPFATTVLIIMAALSAGDADAARDDGRRPPAITLAVRTTPAVAASGAGGEGGRTTELGGGRTCWC